MDPQSNSAIECRKRSVYTLWCLRKMIKKKKYIYINIYIIYIYIYEKKRKKKTGKNRKKKIKATCCSPMFRYVQRIIEVAG